MDLNPSSLPPNPAISFYVISSVGIAVAEDPRDPVWWPGPEMGKVGTVHRSVSWHLLQFSHLPVGGAHMRKTATQARSSSACSPPLCQSAFSTHFLVWSLESGTPRPNWLWSPTAMGG